MKTDRTSLKRLPKRGTHDQETLHAILDAGFLCHVGFVDQGHPFVIPTAYGRQGDEIFIHGSAQSRMLQCLVAGAPACITVTHLDALVLARSAFHHSMNYRSAVILGTGRLVEGDAKMEALAVITDQILADRWQEARLPNAGEMKATSVLAFSLAEASCKIRTGPPGDDPRDMDLPIWAGLLPVHTHFGEPVPSPDLKPGIAMAPSVARYHQMEE